MKKPPDLNRRRFLGSLAISGSVFVFQGLPRLAASEGWPFVFQPELDCIPAPSDPSAWPAFRAQLDAWRAETQRRLDYRDARYRQPEFAWASSAFACCFLMLCDEAFYDRNAGAFKVAAFLDHGRREFGGYDSLVLWHAYPGLGWTIAISLISTATCPAV